MTLDLEPKRGTRAPKPEPPPSGPPLEKENEGDGKTIAPIDRVLRWCLIVFIASAAALGAIAWYAVKTNRVGAYLNFAGIVFVVLSTVFLGVIAVVFVQGHLGSSREIEAPKMELFELEKRR